MSVNAIGPFEFVRLDDPPEIPAEKKIVQARAGVDHVAVFHTGRRSMAAEVRTVSFFSSLGEAWSQYAEYLSLVNSGVAVGVICASVTMPYKVQVLDCRREAGMPKPHIFGMGAGYISRARLVCVWRLQVVELIDEEEA